jgi:hypothetical protein
MSIISASELKEISNIIRDFEGIPLMSIAEDWMSWFKKRGERYLKDAAKNGYKEATIDLPIEIGQTMDKKVLLFIQTSMKEAFEGCFISFVEDEYDSKPVFKVVISWK